MCQGALTVGDSVTRNVSYYIIGQASKFVRPGSVRIASTIAADLYNVAFITPDGKKALVVVNDSDSKKDFAIKTGEKNRTCLSARWGRSNLCVVSRFPNYHEKRKQQIQVSKHKHG